MTVRDPDEGPRLLSFSELLEMGLDPARLEEEARRRQKERLERAYEAEYGPVEGRWPLWRTLLLVCAFCAGAWTLFFLAGAALTELAEAILREAAQSRVPFLSRR